MRAALLSVALEVRDWLVANLRGLLHHRCEFCWSDSISLRYIYIYIYTRAFIFPRWCCASDLPACPRSLSRLSALFKRPFFSKFLQSTLYSTVGRAVSPLSSYIYSLFYLLFLSAGSHSMNSLLSFRVHNLKNSWSSVRRGNLANFLITYNEDFSWNSATLFPHISPSIKALAIYISPI